MTVPIFRFAPSPNGALHLGHAYSALLNAQLAQRAGGSLLLRIEDIDTTRCMPEFEEAIYRDLEWLGFAWERPARRQSQHFDHYRNMLHRLIGEELVYPAFMSRSEIRAHIEDAESRGETWPRDPDGAPLYPGLDKALTRTERRRRIAGGEPFAWRLDTAAAVERLAAPLSWTEFSDGPPASKEAIPARPQEWGDVILARRDTPTSYHLAVVADDALQGVTHVVRGLDLRPATAIHRLMQSLLGLPAPLYHHHRLVVGPDGRKLSKSSRDTGLDVLRQQGKTLADIRHMVGLD